MKIAVFGPKPHDLMDYDQKKYTKFVSQLETELMNIIKNENRVEIITDAAQGFNQLAFWSAFKLRAKKPDITLTLCIPFPAYERKWAYSGLFSQKDYAQMRRNADNVIFANKHMPVDKPMAQIITEAQQNIASDADVLLCAYPDEYWNLPIRNNVAEIMRYGVSQQKKIIRIGYSATEPEMVLTGVYPSK